LLYGCNVSQGSKGAAFISAFSAMTGADIAASNNVTGDAAQGGDWVLESKLGDVQTAMVFDESGIQHYQGLLAAGVVSISGVTTQGQPLSAVISDADGVLAVNGYQWSRSGLAIATATANAYTLVQADVNNTLTVTVDYTDGLGAPQSVMSAPTPAVSNVNDAPVGAVTISGVAAVGQTLSAQTGSIADADGLGSFNYQWNRAGAAIPGANGSSYTVTQADAGNAITATVNYTDALGTPESLTSAPTAPITSVNTPGAVSITGTAAKGQLLTASVSDADGLGAGVVAYQWKRDGAIIPGAIASTYTLNQLDVGGTVAVTVSYTDAGNTPENVTSAATEVVINVNSPAVGVPTIIGIAAQNQLLTAAVSAITDADGLGAFSFQWQSGGSDIPGATASAYALTQADVNKSISVTVSYIDGGGQLESVSSAAIGPVANVNDIGVVTVTGGAIDGSVLTVSDIADADGLSSSNFSYQWLRNGAVIGNVSDSYTVVSGDIGAFFSVVVSYTDDLGATEVVTSNVIGAIRPDLPQVNAPPPLGPINATGWFTLVTLDPSFSVTAFDTLDNSSLTATTDSSGQLRPGVNTVIWTATDSAGNVGTATQAVSVVPLAEVSKVQRIAEGSSASFTISLNGDALQYPVSVPYTVSGTAGAEDHNLITAVATINAPVPGEIPAVVIPFVTVDDGQSEGSETIVISLGAPVNAVLGLDAVHTIEIVEDNVPPLVNLEATQLQVDASSGTVTVFAIASDANDGDSLSYDWSGTDNAIANANSTSGAVLSFGANTLAPGFYTLHVEVGDGIETANSTLVLNVVPSLETLDSTLDSDADGFNDAAEGYADSDGDGIADYLDAIAADHVIQVKPGVSDAFVMQTEPGLKLSLGAVAIKAGLGSSQVTQEDVRNYGFAEGEALNDTFGNVGGYFDFTIAGLPVTGQSIHVVIPQIAAMPRASVYRKLVPQVSSGKSEWRDFVQNTSNAVASAAGEEGYCPPPGDPSYTAGLNEGHWCLQLTIEDGGPNDSDGVANNRVTDPGGVGRVLSSVSVGSGGSLHPLVLILGVFTILALRIKKVW